MKEEKLVVASGDKMENDYDAEDTEMECGLNTCDDCCTKSRKKKMTLSLVILR